VVNATENAVTATHPPQPRTLLTPARTTSKTTKKEKKVDPD
jgi:hypothetical protein